MDSAGDVDLIIVGSGVAGLVAARRSQQLGLNVVVLEKSDLAPGFGNGCLSGGWFHAAMLDPKIRTADELYDKVTVETGGFARPDVVRAWAENVRRARTFLHEEGATFAALDPSEESMQNVMMPPRVPAIGRDWKGRGPDLLLTRMYESFIANGGDHRPGHRAVGLIFEENCVTGVVVERSGARILIKGSAVLLADGGFQANAALVARHITSAYKLRGSPNDTGDALIMGQAVGAKAVNLEWFYGYALFRDALQDDRLWPLPAPGALIYAGALVNAHAKRFVDEATKGEIVANAIAKSDTPDQCWVVFDHDAWEKEGRLGDVPANPTIAEVGGTILTANTIAELATLAGLPPEQLEATVSELNLAQGSQQASKTTLYELTGVPGEFVDHDDKNRTSASATGPLEPPRSTMPRTIATAPFYATPVIAGITFTMGGLAVNGRAQVLDLEDKPIRGLYAAGGAMGGLQGGPRIGVAGGWSEATTFALLAAETISAT